MKRGARLTSSSSDATSPVTPTKALSVAVVQATTPGLPAVLGVEVGDHVVYLSGGSGDARLYATTNGKKLHRRAAPSSGLRGTRIVDERLWIVGEFGTLAWSSDRAGSWTEITTTTSECLWDVVRGPKGAFWAAGTGATILTSTKGDTWKEVKHTLKPRDDRADPRIELVPVGVMFTLFNAYWNGKAFVKPRGLKGALAALAIAPSGTIVVVGDHGAAFRSLDGGASYQAIATGTKAHLNDVAVVAGGFLAVGDKGVLRRSEDDGLTWRPLASGTKLPLWSVGSWGDGAFVGGDAALVLRVDAPGDTYWKGAVDDFAPRPVVTADIAPLVAPAQRQRDERFATLFAAAEVAHAVLARKCAQPKLPVDDHARAILAALDDVDEYQVYGDVLQAAGDPRGELIALQTHGQTKPANAYLKKHRAALLGGLAAIKGDAARTDGVELTWRWGFLHAARLAATDAELEEEPDDEEPASVDRWLVTLLDEPAARFLQQLTLGVVTMIDNSYATAIREIGRRARPALRSLYLGNFSDGETEVSWSDLGDVTKLCGALGNLERLVLRSGSMELGKPGQLVFPRLAELEIITGGLARKHLKAIEQAHLPSLARLTLYFGTDRYGGDITLKDLGPLLRSDRFPRLTRLGLCNSEFADELCAILHASSLVAQVTELDLSKGTLSDRGATALATYARGLAHLTTLDVRDSYLTTRGINLLQRALPNTTIVADGQRGGGDPFADRYVSVSE